MEKTKEELLLASVRAALDAGRAIMEVYDDPAADFQVELKADNSPLTIADKRSNSVITTHLATTGIPVLSEESRVMPYAERSGWQRLWVVDPLDGTKEFIKRNGEFTVNIALVEDGRPVLGVIYVPVLRELYWGAAGMGAGKVAGCAADSTFDNIGALAGRSAALPCAKRSGAVVAVASRSHLNEETEAFISSLSARFGEVETVSKGSSLKFCLVAEGVADIYPRFAPTMEWDTAAGQAIAVAASCRVELADLSAPLAYNKENLLNPWFVVYNPKLDLRQ